MLLLEAVDQPLLRTPMCWSLPAAMGASPAIWSRRLGPTRVVVSDVVPDAVEFAAAHFWRARLLVCQCSRSVQWPRSYSLVFVLSLFSHLPRSTWSRWLKVLFDAVEPGGLLVFTTHGVKAADFDHVTLDDEGYFLCAFQ
jgi:hypothetical protein